MALKINDTGIYLKVLFEESYIKNNTVYVTYCTYPNEHEREKEKIREPLFRAFFEKVLPQVTCVEETPIMSKAFGFINNFNYWFFDTKKENLSPELLQFLTDNGLKQEWLNDPIVRDLTYTVTCGKYNGEPITIDLFYTRLKEQRGLDYTNI